MVCPPVCIDDFSDDRRYHRKVLELLECILTDTNVLVTQNIRYDWEILCDPYTEEPIYVRFRYTTDDSEPQQIAAFNQDGTPYAGSLDDLVACEYIGGTSSGLDAEEALFCDDGVQKTRVDIYNAGAIVNTFWLDVLGDPTTEPADPALVQAGACYQQGQVNTVLLCDLDEYGDVISPFLAHVSFVDGVATGFAFTEVDTITPYVPTGTPGACASGGGDVAVPDALSVQLLCDDGTEFLRRIQIDTAGVVTITDTTLDGTTPYVVVGTVAECCCGSVEAQALSVQLLCDVNAGVPTQFLRRIQIDDAGVVTITNTTLTGTAAYVPTGTVAKCDDAEQVVVGLCDSTGVAFLRHYIYTLSVLSSTFDTDFDGVTFVPTGAVGACEEYDAEWLLLCDNDAGTIVEFLRQISVDTSGDITVTDYELDATTPCAVVGTVERCADNSADALSIVTLCDVNAGVPTPFLRRIQIDADGVVTVTNTTLTGTAAYTPTGTVGLCWNDVETKLLCDVDEYGDTIAQFLRKYSYTPAGGTVVTDTELDGTSSYTVVGTVEQCCCENTEEIIAGRVCYCDQYLDKFEALRVITKQNGLLVSVRYVDPDTLEEIVGETFIDCCDACA